jgi:tetratricopeptide (TPR) repeat protein
MDYIKGFGYGAIIAGLLAAGGVVLFFVIGLPLIHRFGRGASNLYLSSDDSFRVLPEYSVAEARVKRGRYQEAVDEYRNVIAEHPDDIYPHLRIADLALTHLNDLKLAELELQSAFGKAVGEDSTALAAGRLADLYQHTLHEPTRALEVMKQVSERIPGTKRVKLAEERIAVLERLAAGEPPPTATPDKIAIRPSRYKMPE